MELEVSLERLSSWVRTTKNTLEELDKLDHELVELIARAKDSSAELPTLRIVGDHPSSKAPIKPITMYARTSHVRTSALAIELLEAMRSAVTEKRVALAEQVEAALSGTEWSTSKG